MAETLETIENLLQSALACITQARSAEGQDAVRSATSAAWRIADAGLILRTMCEAENITGAGLTDVTGRGALLPVAMRPDGSPATHGART